MATLALVRRSALVAALAGTLLAVLAAPAAAHGRGSDATNFLSRILSAPDVPGLEWRVYGGDELLGLTNTSGQEVMVPGYNDEPYLRIGPDGVFRNLNSPATYLNQDRYADVDAPPRADADAPPDWERISEGNRHLWHDHRIHYMAAVLPPAITAEPDRVHDVFGKPWVVPFQIGGQRLEVTGDLRWIPGGSPWPWLLAGLAVTLPALAGLRTAPGDERWPGLARPAAAVVGVLALANVFHLVDDLTAVPLPLTTTLLNAVQTALFIVMAAMGAVRGWQARDGAFTAIGVGSAALLIGQGLLYLSVLTTSQNASVFPEAVTRLVVAASIAQIVPVGAVAVLGTRRLLPDYEDGEPAPLDAEPATA